MIEPETFEMIESVSQAALEKHPVWAHFENRDDRTAILDWGVGRDRLDDEIARYDHCGTQPLYPVMQVDPLPPLRHLIVAVTFESGTGQCCAGYMLAPHAYGIFVGDREYCLNRNLAALSARVATRLAEALDTPVDDLFPFQYESRVTDHDGVAIRGTLDRFW
jgi:hypothetical protein